MAATAQAVDTTEPVSDTVWEISANNQESGVVTGCTLTLSGSNLTVDIATAGTVVLEGSVLTVAAEVGAVTLVADASNPRFTWIGVASDGDIEIVSGAAASDPAVPELGSRVALALVRIPANETLASNCTEIVKRIPYRVSPVLVEGPQLLIPMTGQQGTAGRQLATNTTASVGMFALQHPQTWNSISFEVSAVGGAGTLVWGVFSNDGQTRFASETTASISGTGLHTDALATPVTLPPGLYYFVVAPVGAANLSLTTWSTIGGMAFAAPSGENEVCGTLTVSAGTIPSTFDPDGDVTFAQNHAVVVRID